MTPLDPTETLATVRRLERTRQSGLVRKLLTLSPRRTVWLQVSARKSSRPWTAKTVFGDPMVVTPPDTPSMWIARYGYFEADVMALVHATVSRGSIFVDVGAHLGFFSLWAARLTGPEGHVYALEPTPQTAALLRSNVAGASAPVTTFERAAFDRHGEIEFVDFGTAGAAFNGPLAAMSNDHRAGRRAGHAGRISVACDTLDALLLDAPRIDCIKIDAEGSEGEVLNGAQAILKRDRPSLIIETGDFSRPGRTRAVLDEVLGLGGYVPFEVDQDLRVVPHTVLTRYSYGNLLLALPERLTPIRAAS